MVSPSMTRTTWAVPVVEYVDGEAAGCVGVIVGGGSMVGFPFWLSDGVGASIGVIVVDAVGVAPSGGGRDGVSTGVGEAWAGA